MPSNDIILKELARIHKTVEFPSIELEWLESFDFTLLAEIDGCLAGDLQRIFTGEKMNNNAYLNKIKELIQQATKINPLNDEQRKIHTKLLDYLHLLEKIDQALARHRGHL